MQVKYNFWTTILVVLLCIIVWLGNWWHNPLPENSTLEKESPLLSPASPNSSLLLISQEAIDTEELGSTSSPTATLPPLALVGTILSQMGDMAVIQCEQGKEDLYRIGDTVTGGWVLNKIFSNRIIITNYDSSIVVPMSMLGGNGFDDPEEEEGPLTAAEGADAIKRKALKRLESQEFRDKLAVYLNGRHPTEVEFPLGVKSHGITAISENEFDIERQAVLWQLIINPLDHYFKYTLEENGFQFTEIVPGSLFDASEFRTGDQIIKVNNKKVRNPTDLGRFFLDNMNSQLLTIDFYRGDVAMVHYYYMK